MVFGRVISIAVSLVVVLCYVSAEEEEYHPWETCFETRNKNETELMYRLNGQVKAGFRGQFKLSKGVLRPVSLDSVEWADENGGKILKMNLDCGTITIEMRQNLENGIFSSGQLHAVGRRSNGQKFRCRADTGGIITLARDQPFKSNGTITIKCLDDNNQEDKAQIIIDELFVDTHFNGFFDHCILSPNKFEPVTKYRETTDALLGFAGQFKLADGYYQPLHFDKFSLKLQPGGPIVSMEFDCGTMSIEFTEDARAEEWRSTKILAKGERTDGLQFNCQVKDTNGAIVMDFVAGFGVDDHVFDCEDENNNKTGNQVIIDEFFMRVLALH